MDKRIIIYKIIIIIYKIILLTFKALNGLAPQYIAEMISHYEPSRCLRSSKANLLNEPRFNVNSYGGRAFYTSSPRLWNKLPVSIRACTDISEFKTVSLRPTCLK
jgi:hypothetical protein